MLANILSSRYSLVLILTVAVALLVTAVRTHVYVTQVRDHSLAAQEWRRTMEGVKWDWQSVGLGLVFEKQPEPLAIFAFGLENEMTRSVQFCEYYPDHAGLRKLGITSFRYFSQIDLVAVIFFGFSLLALILVFDSVSAERERGTLRILLSGPVNRSTIVLAKIVGGLVTLAAPLALAWGVSIAYAVMMSGHVFSADDVVRLGGMIGVSLLFVSAVFAAGLAASCWANSSNTSLVIVLFAWLLMVLLLPAGAKAIADAVQPVPTYASLEQDKQGVFYAVISEEAIDKMVDEITRQEPDLSFDEIWNRINRRLSEQGQKIEGTRENRVRNNVAIFRQLLRISPAWSFMSVATSLAGTGPEDYLKLLTDIRLFRREFEAASEEQKRVANAKKQGLQWWEWDRVVSSFSPDLWPRFSFARQTMRQLMHPILTDCLWICGIAVLFFVVAVAGFVRKEV